MEEKIEKVLNRKFSIKRVEEPGEKPIYGVIWGCMLISSYKTLRAARVAKMDFEELVSDIQIAINYQD